MIDRLCEPGMVVVTWLSFAMMGIGFVFGGLMMASGEPASTTLAMAGIWAIACMASWVVMWLEPARPDAQEACE